MRAGWLRPGGAAGWHPGGHRSFQPSQQALLLLHVALTLLHPVHAGTTTARGACKGAGTSSGSARG